MRKLLAGSKIVRGKKNRRNIRKHVVKNPTMAAQTIRRRILLTGGSGALSTTAPAALRVGFAAGGDAFAGAEGGGGVTAWFPDTGGEVFDDSGDSSSLFGLSTLHTSVAWNLRPRPTRRRRYTCTSIAEPELYNSPQSRDHSLRNCPNYLRKH